MDDTPVRYRVTFPDICRDQLREIAAEAARQGVGPEVSAGIREVQYRLSVEADEWGESRGYLPVLQLDLRVGIAHILTVWYAVNVAERLVVVQRFHLHGGLAGES
jgi:hypothetical protein